MSNNVPSEFLKAHAKVMLGYSTVFTINIGIQFAIKMNLLKSFKAHKAKLAAEGKDVSDLRYNRYADVKLIVADRIVGNFIEWAPIFMTLFGTNVALGNDVAALGWSYVALRFLYPFFAFAGGITEAGANPRIFGATMPMYGILLLLGKRINEVVFN